MNNIRKIIQEIITKLTTKDKCNCGCHDCDNVGNPGVVINESLNAQITMTENLRYHVENKLPLTENTFRYGSKAFLDLWAEARYLYVREAIHVNDLDKEMLTETNLGEYGIFEGQKVPLDMPMVYENEIGNEEDVENAQDTMLLPYADLIDKLSDSYHIATNPKLKKLYGYLHDEILDASMNRDSGKINQIMKKYGKFLPTNLNEEKKDPPIGKPKRGGAGGKKYYVYVRNPKTKNIKKVSFGDSGGLKTKINNPKARHAFAKRHNCAQKTDRTLPSYWSCRIGRYWKSLGGSNNFSGYW